MKTLKEISGERLQTYAPKAADDLRSAIFSKDYSSNAKRAAKRTAGLQRAAARLRGEPVLTFKAHSKMQVS